MSDTEDQNNTAQYESEAESPAPQQQKQNQVAQQQRPQQQQQQQQSNQQLQQQRAADNEASGPHYRTYDDQSLRRAPVREGRIKDRKPGAPAGDSALKIKIELDLEVEVDLYARVKGDITIGLM